MRRYAPERPLPPYAYVPGGALPHPTQDPRGHSYRAEPPPRPEYLAPGRWRENQDYLYGVDLYNAGFLWEAHEVWEGLWHGAKHDPVQSDVLQGLIQCAAAALKVPMGQPRGLERLARAGTERLEGAARRAGGPCMGLELFHFARAFRDFAASSPASADERPPLELE
jgi:hypothetical protein